MTLDVEEILTFFGRTVQRSRVQNPSVIPLYWLVYGDSPIGLLNNPQHIG